MLQVYETIDKSKITGPLKMCYSALVKANLTHFEERFGAIIHRESFDLLSQKAKSDPKHYRDISRRIFPDTSYAPIVFIDQGKLVVEPMRYGIFLSQSIQQWWQSTAKKPGSHHAGKPTNYNVRRDNIHSKFWDTAFMQNHGFAIIEGFYENVRVKDLLNANVITIEEIGETFKHRSQVRKQKILAQGKKYSPTKIEQMPLLDRNIEIYFESPSDAEMIVPIVFNTDSSDKEFTKKGFAFITDEPLPEVAAAGHDRSPIFLNYNDISSWLQTENKTLNDFDQILAKGQHVVLTHSIASNRLEGR